MGGEDTPHLAPDLGLILALLRTARGWSQATLAREADIPAGSISQYESGKKLPELSSLIRMLDAMRAGFSDIDRARVFLLSQRLSRSPGDRSENAAAMDEPPDSLAEQIAAMTCEAGAAVSRLTDAIALLIRERPCANRRRGDEETAQARTTATPSPEDRLRAAALWKRLQKYAFPFQEILVRESPDFQDWALCEVLCHESEDQAGNDARIAAQLATLAVRIAELAPGDELWRLRLQGYASAFLGNALRVQGDLRSSENAFTRSDGFWQAGSECRINLLQEVRLLGLRASLLRSQRHFNDSLELLARAIQADQRGSLTGRLLIKRSKTLQEMGNLEAAEATLAEVEVFVDPEEDPKLLAWLQHTRADYLSKLGRFAQAESLLPQAKALYRQLDSALNLLRLRWVEGRIEDGLGRTERGIEILTQVRGEFARQSMPYDVALVSLELATILAREGETDRVKTLARHMAPIFQSQAVHREALAALTLFRQAAETERLSVDLAQRLLDYLHRARHDPELRFES